MWSCVLTAVALGATRMRRRGCCIPLVAASLTFVSVSGHANDEAKSFDIPAQSLSMALEAFSTASGYQLLVADRVPATALSSPVQGVFAPRDALSRLIAGAGFEVTYTSARAAILVRGTRALQEDAQQRVRYEISLQADTIDRLCQSAVTRPGSYRAAIDIWVAPTGRVQRAELLDSTGDSGRDQQLLSALRTMTTAGPPGAMTQPTTLIIQPKPDDRRNVCEAQIGDQRAGRP